MNDFRKLYENAYPLSLKGLSLEEQYAIIGIKDHFTLSKRRVEDELANRALTALDASGQGENISRTVVDELLHAFYYNYELYGQKDDKEYFIALHELIKIAGSKLNKFAAFSNISQWEEGLKWLKTYMAIGNNPTDFDLSITTERQKLRIEALRNLQKKGVTHHLSDDNKIVVDGLEKVLTDITSMMEAIGGVRFVNTLLSKVSFDNEKGRLLFPRNSNSNVGKVTPETPVCYLLNLAYAKTGYKGSDAAVAKYFNSLIKEATDLCIALYPVQATYGFVDSICNEPLQYMQQWVIYDSLNDVPQMSRSFGLDLMNFLISKIEGDGRYFARDYSLSEYKAIMNELCNKAENNTFIQIKRKDITSITVKEHKEGIIKDIANDKPNLNFESPLDYDKVTYSDLPTILLPNGDILLYPASLGMAGWYERMMALLREQDEIKKKEIEEKAKSTNSRPEKYVCIDNFVGLRLEEYIRKCLSDKGICSKAGIYADKKDGECDVEVENDKKILLMEVKKKNLTRNARKGYIFQILLDFAGSLFNSQEQAFHTESIIRDKSKIDLIDMQDGGKTVTIDYLNRDFEKITVTLNEYGPLHDRVIQQNVLRSFIKYTYHTKEDEIINIVQDEDQVQRILRGYATIGKKQEKLFKHFELILSNIADNNTDILFDSWFYSLEQLCFLIKVSKDTDDFVQKFADLKYMTFSTKDFWLEYDWKMKMANRP